MIADMSFPSNPVASWSTCMGGEGAFNMFGITGITTHTAVRGT
jgi:hypothetical protein